MDHVFYVGQRVTWNRTGNPDVAQRFIRNYGEFVVIHKVEHDGSISPDHSQIVWLSENMGDRFSGWWFQPASFFLDDIT
jgi:hypothetical protein